MVVHALLGCVRSGGDWALLRYRLCSSDLRVAGNICLDILKENWSAAYSVRTILLSIQVRACDMCMVAEASRVNFIHEIYTYETATCIVN